MLALAAGGAGGDYQVYPDGVGGVAEQNMMQNPTTGSVKKNVATIRDARYDFPSPFPSFSLSLV